MVDLLKTFLSREVETKIDEYVLKMKSKNFLSELNLDLNSKFISLKSYNLHDLEQLKSIWLEIANLSVNLYVEYEFFRQFSFPNRFESKIYEENLKKLGYQQYNGMWRIDKIPNRQCIIENIFYSYIYIFLCQEKKQELDNERFMKENAENSLLNLRNTGTNNDTINEQFNPINIVPVVAPPNIEMGNIDNDLCEICSGELLDGECTICMNISGPRMNNQPANCDVIDSNRVEEPILKVDELNVKLASCNLSDNATCSTVNNNSQKSKEISEDSHNVNEMKLNSSKISHNSKIKSNPSTQWTCNVCSYENDNNNINCEYCMSSKFAKINSCVFESSFEASNAKKIDSVKHVENKDKWTCAKCTDNYELPEETWCCKTCRENNLFESYKCKKCREPAEFYNKWRCGQCSHYNAKLAKHCAICYIRNPYLVKCNLCMKGLVNKMYDNICNETFDYQDNGEAPSEVTNLTALIYSLGGDVSGPKNKMNAKPCKNCKSKVWGDGQYWCTKCEDSQWYCQNEGCDGINFKNEYCKKCKAKNGSDFSKGNNFEVMKGDGYKVWMWQCEFCFQFNGGRFNKCRCQNLRYLPCYIKCENCNWNNLKYWDNCYYENIKLMKKCNKCDAQIG